MARTASGSLYRQRGVWYVAISLKDRIHVALRTCTSEAQAQLRQAVIKNLVEQLRAAKKLDLAETVCRQVGQISDEHLPGLVQLVGGLAAGTEQVALVARQDENAATSSKKVTVEEFGRKWTSGKLAQEFRRRVKVIDHHDNAARLERYVYPLIFRPKVVTATTTHVSERIGTIPMGEFSVEHADFILSQPSLPDGSLHNVGALIRRLCRLAAYPARLIELSPLPPGWAPQPNPRKERSFLFPSEEARLIGCTGVPLVRRLLFAFLAREGLRKENAVTVEWANLTLDGLSGGGGHIVLDRTKNGRGGSWSLDLGTAEGLRRWRRLCPSTRWVFPAEALPGHRRKDQPLYVDRLAADLREGLLLAGVCRPKLFETSAHRMRLRAHDLRSTFVTVALATGRSEAWVSARTGHRSTIMISRYRVEATSVDDLIGGWFAPMHTTIPELSALGPSQSPNVTTASAQIISISSRRNM